MTDEQIKAIRERLEAVLAEVKATTGDGPYFLDTSPPTSAYIMADGSLRFV